MTGHIMETYAYHLWENIFVSGNRVVTLHLDFSENMGLSFLFFVCYCELQNVVGHLMHLQIQGDTDRFELLLPSYNFY